MNDENLKDINLPEAFCNIEPLTFKEIYSELEESEQKRLSNINQEFLDGFQFIRKYPKSISFFGSSRTKEGDKHYEQVRKLASRVSKECGYTIVTGGGPGVMEAANRGAKEAGGHSLGLNIKLPKEQVRNPYQTDSLNFYYFFIRKVVLTFSAEAFIFLPGGFGTLDEFFEIVTLLQTKKIPDAPIILMGSDYWRPLDNFIKETVLNEHKAISPEDTNIYTITDNEDEVIEIIKNTAQNKI